MIGLDLWIPYSTWISSGKQWTAVAVGKQLMGQQAGGLASVCLPPSVGTPAAPPLKLILSDSSPVAFGINCTIQIHDSLFLVVVRIQCIRICSRPKAEEDNKWFCKRWKLKQPVQWGSDFCCWRQHLASMGPVSALFGLDHVASKLSWAKSRVSLRKFTENVF